MSTSPSSHLSLRNRQCTRWPCVRYALCFKHPPHVYSCSIIFDVLAYAVLRADVTAARKGRFALGRRRRRRWRNYKVAGSRDVAVIKKFLTHYVKRTKTHNSRAVPACLPATAASARVYNYVDETISLNVVPVYLCVYAYTRVRAIRQPLLSPGKRRKTRTSSLSYYCGHDDDDAYDMYTDEPDI